MKHPAATPPLPDPASCAAERGFVPLPVLFRAAAAAAADAAPETIQSWARGLCEAWNHPQASREALARAAAAGEDDAADTLAWMELQGLDPAPLRRLPPERSAQLHRRLEADPEGFARLAEPWPASAENQHWGFDPDWIGARLALGRGRLERMRAELTGGRLPQGDRCEVAVLVGNGPSLALSDLSLLCGPRNAGQEGNGPAVNGPAVQDPAVFVSNYALGHPQLGPLARGVGVTNYFVAAQAPQLFHPLLRPDPAGPAPWRILPVWLGHVLADSDRTIWLNALGGPLFFSDSPETRIAWHASVSYFWMQALLGLGYRKLLLIGFDHSYSQPAGVREGTLLRQEGDDPNHFDPGYFRGRLWQAADVDHMAAAYRLARRHWEAKGGEIVNCTVGGALEVFRRGDLAQELA